MILAGNTQTTTLLRMLGFSWVGRLTFLITVIILSVEGCQPLTINSESYTENVGSRQPRTLYLLALAPYPDLKATGRFKPAWTGGPGIIPAARLAVKQINQNKSILPNYNLSLIERDSGCNDLHEKALVAFTSEIFHSGKHIVGIIGSPCSQETLKLGYLSGPNRAAMVQVTIATSLLLAN